MRFSKVCTAFVLALGVLAVAAPAKAGFVTWNVDPDASFLRLTIPDTAINLDGTNVTVRLRNANNSAWSDAGGRRAFIGGTIDSNFVDGSSIEFLSGQSNLVGLNSGNFRPNPAAFDPNATNVDNPNGTFTNTSTAPAVFAAKARASISILTLDAAFLAFRDVFFDLASGVLALDGGGAFAGGTNDFGIASANVDLDGLSIAIVGQPIPDTLNQVFTNILGTNSSGGVVTDLGGLDRRLDLPINIPIQIDLGDGIVLNATAAGNIRAFATIPEPSSVLLAGFAAFGLIWAGRRRIRRSSRERISLDDKSCVAGTPWVPATRFLWPSRPAMPSVRHPPAGNAELRGRP